MCARVVVGCSDCVWVCVRCSFWVEKKKHGARLLSAGGVNIINHKCARGSEPFDSMADDEILFDDVYELCEAIGR